MYIMQCLEKEISVKYDTADFLFRRKIQKKKPEREKIFAGGNVHHDAGIGRLQRWDAGNVGDVRGLDGTDR